MYDLWIAFCLVCLIWRLGERLSPARPTPVAKPPPPKPLTQAQWIFALECYQILARNRGDQTMVDYYARCLDNLKKGNP
jgi:hypothetical protein